MGLWNRPPGINLKESLIRRKKFLNVSVPIFGKTSRLKARMLETRMASCWLTGSLILARLASLAVLGSLNFCQFFLLCDEGHFISPLLFAISSFFVCLFQFLFWCSKKKLFQRFLLACCPFLRLKENQSLTIICRFAVTWQLFIFSAWRKQNLRPPVTKLARNNYKL